MPEKGKNMKNKPIRLEGYLKTLRKALKSAQVDFWKEMRAADGVYHKEIAQAMRDYEKVEYSDKRVPGALAEAAKSFNDRCEAAYQALGKTTKEALGRFQKMIEELIGV